MMSTPILLNLKKMYSSFYFVSSNLNKIREFKELLGIPIESIPIEIDEIQTTDLDALLKHKVQQAYKKIKAPVIVEDTALFFNAWNELPGPLIKWFLKELGVRQLVQALSSFEDKTAKAVCGVGYTDGESFHFFEGMIEGKIVPPRGDYGFGWDSIFQPTGSFQTFAEMNPAQKNKISMRRRALEKFSDFLKERSS